MELQVNAYVFFQDKSCKILEKLPGEKLRIQVGHRASGPITRDVREDEVTTINLERTAGSFPNRGHFPMKKLDRLTKARR